jgi:hypothetical protein
VGTANIVAIAAKSGKYNVGGQLGVGLVAGRSERAVKKSARATEIATI